jgi:hypothetical protein
MQAMTIRNMKDSEVYFKNFHSMDEARNWVINHLDLSKEWLIILIKPKDVMNPFASKYNNLKKIQLEQ